MKKRTTITIDKRTQELERRIQQQYGVGRSLAYRMALPYLLKALQDGLIVSGEDNAPAHLAQFTD